VEHERAVACGIPPPAQRLRVDLPVAVSAPTTTPAAPAITAWMSAATRAISSSS
jgi:hypothetical protein